MTPVFGPYHADLSSLRRLGVMAVAAPVLEQLTLAVAGFVVFVTGMIAVAAHHETATLSSHCCRNKILGAFRWWSTWSVAVTARRGG
jgi:hypothetical protein